MVKRFPFPHGLLALVLFACYFLAGPAEAADEMRSDTKKSTREIEPDRAQPPAREKSYDRMERSGRNKPDAADTNIKGSTQPRAYSVCDMQPTLCRD